MRGILKVFFLFDSPHPGPLPQGEGVFLLNGSDAPAWEQCNSLQQFFAIFVDFG